MPFNQEVTTETVQTMKVMNNDVRQTQKQTFYFRWTPLGKDGDNQELEQRVEGVALDMDIGGNKITYDSTLDESSTNPLAAFYKALVGSRFKEILNKENRVQKLEKRDDLVPKY